MSNQVFQQNLDDKKGPQPGGPYLIQMLFKEPVDMPDKDEMTAVMKKHIGRSLLCMRGYSKNQKKSHTK